MDRRSFIGLLGLGLAGGQLDALAAEAKAVSRKRYVLKPDQAWRLTAPNKEQFDASGLLLMPNGDLLTVNDKRTGLYKVKLPTEGMEARLESIPGWFTEKQLAPYKAAKSGHWDLEGIARDEAGRIYVCEEGNRWVLRLDPKSEKVERLDIDWAPVKKYFSDDGNASWEGIAVGEGRLYLANERSRGRIIVVDLKSLEVVSDFSVGAAQLLARDMQYTDLSWHGGHLYVLMREARAVLQVDPKTEQVVAEFDIWALENSPEHAYHRLYPTGIMEGLAVDAENIWVVTDNNGFGRLKDSTDRRPTLFRCKRPKPVAPAGQ
jgi:hypothetical protein